MHEDDVVDAIIGLLDGGHAGAFNITGDGVMTMRETAEVLGAKVRKMPLRLARTIGRVTWRLGASETPPGQIEFAMNPWVCSNEKVKETLGWQPRYTTPRDFRDHDARPRRARKHRRAERNRARGGRSSGLTRRCYASADPGR